MRDTALEALIHDELARGARHEHGEDIGPFIQRIRERGDHGARLYGDDAFLSPNRDNVAEGVDEAADGVMYATFEIQVLNLDAHPPDEARIQFFNAARAFTLAHLCLRRGRRIHRAAH